MVRTGLGGTNSDIEACCGGNPDGKARNGAELVKQISRLEDELAYSVTRERLETALSRNNNPRLSVSENSNQISLMNTDDSEPAKTKLGPAPITVGGKPAPPYLEDIRSDAAFAVAPLLRIIRTLPMQTGNLRSSNRAQISKRKRKKVE
ncbi:hypothetical protein F1559_002454 [Cyanidiococcus yangmingshanensis]|uniref:Uncharacterized protein n=1 Tax=Cyanidiococcus yangmingshanensis TaxID=2690220 RepID=A0A7J7IEX9_9RHOD|nr:hypothetical protein F1559_002454 [Cyanidiococcus yangmingshanensis]